ncbi:GDSL-type esterase/lipase family protein [Rubrolithibacter danxiaensis]|uniref:GDSL-type esterase/lipase family protein n=1 Tax=Rubrolithibacter danxiaensis TaxID=3390805 RepID=UPI003BF7DCFE
MNKKSPLIIVFGLLFFFISENVFAQKVPFWNDIQAFKKQDSLRFPPKDAILFIGSSSFTKWKDVQSYFPEYKIINRGFGGSTLKDLIRYADDIITPYHAKQIVIYCGDNDLAESDTVTPQLVFSRFKKLFNMIRDKQDNVNVTYVSIKPSPSRKHLMPKMAETNKLIKDYLKSQKATAFVDVYSKMLNEKGNPTGEIFLGDSLHMNSKGYKIWKKEIGPYLIR